MKPSFARCHKMNTPKILKNQYHISFITKKKRNFLIGGVYYLYILLVALKRAEKGPSKGPIKGLKKLKMFDINILSTRSLPSNLKIKKLQIKEYYQLTTRLPVIRYFSLISSLDLASCLCGPNINLKKQRSFSK